MKKIALIALTILVTLSSAMAKPAKKVKGVPFGTVFAEKFISDLSDSYTGDAEEDTYKIQQVTVTALKKGKDIIDHKTNHIACRSISFVSASSGDAVLTLKVRVAKAVKNEGSGKAAAKTISIYKNGTLVDGRTLRNENSDKYMTGTFDIRIPDVKVKDEIKIVCEASSYHRIAEFSWNKAE